MPFAHCSESLKTRTALACLRSIHQAVWFFTTSKRCRRRPQPAAAVVALTRATRAAWERPERQARGHGQHARADQLGMHVGALLRVAWTLAHALARHARSVIATVVVSVAERRRLTYVVRTLGAGRALGGAAADRRCTEARVLRIRCQWLTDLVRADATALLRLARIAQVQAQATLGRQAVGIRPAGLGRAARVAWSCDVTLGELAEPAVLVAAYRRSSSS